MPAPDAEDFITRMDEIPSIIQSINDTKKIQHESLAEQANKVLDSLSKLPKENSNSNIVDIAKRVQFKLMQRQKHIGNINKIFSNHDVHRKGRVSYGDLKSVLVHSGVDLKPGEYDLTTKAIDPSNSGMIDYTNIMSALSTIQSSASKNDIDEVEDGVMRTDTLDLSSSLPSDNLFLGRTTPASPPMQRHFIPRFHHNSKKGEEESEQPSPRALPRRFAYSANQNPYVPFQERFSGAVPSSTTAGRRKRSSSAPPLRPRTLKTVVVDSAGAGSKEAMVTAGSETDAIGADISVTPAAISNPSSCSLTPAASLPQKNPSIDNLVLTQLPGSLSNLRKSLRKFDASYSGYLNKDEFQAALRHSGIDVTAAALATAFDNESRELGDSGRVGFDKNSRALKIDDFVDRIVSKATSGEASQQGLMSEAVTTRHRETEEARVFKKVLLASEKLSDPLQVFNHIEPRYKRWVDKAQLRDGLSRIGAELSDSEFAILARKVDVIGGAIQAGTGRFDVADLKKTLRQSVENLDSARAQENGDALRANVRYSNTYKSTPGALEHKAGGIARTHEFSKSLRGDSLSWHKLKRDLAARVPDVLSVFEEQQARGKGESGGDGEAIVAVGELRARLSDRGVFMGDEDEARLTQHISRAAVNGDSSSDAVASSAISLRTFCDAVGLQYKNVAADKIEVSDPRSAISEHGIFTGSVEGPVHSTSAHSHVERPTLGWSKRRASLPSQPHTSDPSRFWELPQAIGAPEIFVSPMYSFRSTNVSADSKLSFSKSLHELSLNSSHNNSQGIGVSESLDPNWNSVGFRSPSRGRLRSGVYNPESSIRMSDGGLVSEKDHVAGDQGSVASDRRSMRSLDGSGGRRRSRSAPPTTTGSLIVHTQHQAAVTDTTAETGLSAAVANKWATSSLASFIADSSPARPNTPTASAPRPLVTLRRQLPQSASSRSSIGNGLQSTGLAAPISGSYQDAPFAVNY